MSYLAQLEDRYKAESHHAFILHGNTRDLQLGESGSCGLVDHLIAKFTARKFLPIVFRVGSGWRFAVDSDKATFLELVGLGQASAGAFASLQSSDDYQLPLELSEAIALVDIAMRQTKARIVLILDRLELIAPNAAYDRMQQGERVIVSLLQALASDAQVVASQNVIIGITDTLTDIHESIRLAASRWFAIEITPPSYDERLVIANQVLVQLQDNGVVVELTPSEFAQATSMLTRYGLMDVFSDATLSGSLTTDQVRTVKARVMSQEYGDILTTLEPLENGFDDIAGMDAIKEYFQDSIFAMMLAGRLMEVPSGLLIAGAPGLGKTYLMRGAAGASGLPVINFNVGKLLGSFVGQSERNLERALTAIMSAAPCLVLLDEIETTFPDRASSGPSGDSGVSSRILKRMLEVLSDPNLRGRVVWIGLTNYPDRLDAALARAGRFDLTVAVLPPTLDERCALVKLYAKKYNVPSPLPDTLDILGARTNGYTNAEIETVVRKFQAMHYGTRYDGLTTEEKWLGAQTKVRANTRNVAEMTDSALRAVNDSDLLHPDYVDRWKRVTGQIEDTKAPAQALAGERRGNRAF